MIKLIFVKRKKRNSNIHKFRLLRLGNKPSIKKARALFVQRFTALWRLIAYGIQPIAILLADDIAIIARFKRFSITMAVVSSCFLK